MEILVDADACPVISQVESVAQKHNVPVTLFMRYKSHIGVRIFKGSYGGG